MAAMANRGLSSACPVAFFRFAPAAIAVICSIAVSPNFILSAVYFTRGFLFEAKASLLEGTHSSIERCLRSNSFYFLNRLLVVGIHCFLIFCCDRFVLLNEHSPLWNIFANISLRLYFFFFLNGMYCCKHVYCYERFVL